MENILSNALLAGVMTWGITALGAASVFFVKEVNKRFLNLMLGFASGVMVAASFWSLLQPSIEMAMESRTPAWLIAAIGFLAGGAFLAVVDKVIGKKTIDKVKNSKKHRQLMLLLSITVHNIPEGLAVGVAYGMAGVSGDPILYASAFALALGIGIQNFPEGIASAIPLRAEGMSKFKSFYYGQMTAIVEPVSCIFGAILVTQIRPILPYALAFAAGAMIYVVVQELIPEAQSDKEHGTTIATVGVMIGFACMMILDVALG